MMNPMTKKRIQFMFHFHPMTMILIILNLLMVFVVMFFGGFNNLTLYRLGALAPTLITEEAEYYRMFTVMFLHGSLFHFLLNAFALYFLGSYLERLVGPIRFLTLYILSGLFSSVAVVLLSPNVLTVGASGAIFGVVGGLLVLTFIRPYWFTDALIRQLRQLIVLNLVLTFVIGSISVSGHLGGFIAGIGLFFILLPEKPYFHRKTKELVEKGTYFVS
jgi:rhomboid protease GluP